MEVSPKEAPHCLARRSIPRLAVLLYRFFPILLIDPTLPMKIHNFLTEGQGDDSEGLGSNYRAPLAHNVFQSLMKNPSSPSPSQAFLFLLRFSARAKFLPYQELLTPCAERSMKVSPKEAPHCLARRNIPRLAVLLYRFFPILLIDPTFSDEYSLFLTERQGGDSEGLGSNFSERLLLPTSSKG